LTVQPENENGVAMDRSAHAPASLIASTFEAAGHARRAASLYYAYGTAQAGSD
jgi:hypothetical protein